MEPEPFLCTHVEPQNLLCPKSFGSSRGTRMSEWCLDGCMHRQPAQVDVYKLWKKRVWMDGSTVATCICPYIVCPVAASTHTSILSFTTKPVVAKRSQSHQHLYRVFLFVWIKVAVPSKLDQALLRQVQKLHQMEAQTNPYVSTIRLGLLHSQQPSTWPKSATCKPGQKNEIPFRFLGASFLGALKACRPRLLLHSDKQRRRCILGQS
jgi:hypothetical protein